MKILKVIHGYPMRYNAGSEVYSQTLCHALAERHEVHVFTREEDAFAPDFRMRTERDPDDRRITIHLVNNPRLKDRYRATAIDQRFTEVLEQFRPDIVHVGHLNHLSTSLLKAAAAREVPIIYTLHDYWLMCPRGQFMQMFPKDPDEVWAACDGQDDRKCAERCYARYFSGAADEREADVAYWTDWVARRMAHVREMASLVDLFIAPARYLHDRYRDAFGLPERKLVYLDYGFDRERMAGRSRADSEPFTFGYIGTHIPAKGIHDLIRAFGRLEGGPRLRIWGRPRGQDTEALRSIASALPTGVAERIEWLPEYKNQEIVRDVFNQCDAIVVPSVWVENSPLVIHEAQQARVPVVTGDAGGMAEYVQHEMNGLLFEHRSVEALAEQMQRFVDDPVLAERLGARGYPHTSSGDVPDIEDHARAVERLYERALERRDTARVRRRPGPWRITFDTNPDTCNLRCIMCEEHSPHSSLQVLRRAEGRPRRLMPFELIERVVAEAAPHGLEEIIPSTMGEPLLYERFEDILKLCDRYGVRLNLTTNGTFPRLGAEAWARKIVPVTSDVKVSWNGATKATHEAIMLGAGWEKVLENVRTFVAVRDEHAAEGGNRCRVTFQLTFIERNVAELADIVRLAIDLGVDRVKGHHLWAHFDEIRDQSMRRDPESARRWNQAVLEAREAAGERTLPDGRHILLENFFLLEDEAAAEELAPGGACPFLGQEAWVSAVGRFDPCCAPDAQRRTLGEFGSLHEKSLMEIWNGPAYGELLSTYRNRPLCLECSMRKPVVDDA
ncbi:MAG: radical SAM protein [Sandaracinus sp.]|nr:radical SAM protein [Sandaracinus sp.]MBJ71797.1 radical SAM protein [Sandaracinus sp.]HJL22377.1 glycosyltransferase [Polyangiaceae bacterium LLY-WYZ-15_(1-7)]HJL32451.1 glycosyltransferase [Polyangiaceae bacterium LLY-WYZ-15_(1-7)]